MDYTELVMQLEKEWPAQRLRDFSLDYWRESCKWALARRDGIELENKEARVRGVPYAERKKYSVQIEALNGLFLKWKNRGVYYDRHPIKMHELVQPEDLPYIHSVGFEQHLRSALCW